MDKQKKIEEMEQYLVQSIVCSKSWKPRDIIEHLTKMIIPENAVVLTREEFEMLLNERKHGNGYRYGKENTEAYYEREVLPKARKETAEKFAEKTNQAINAHRKRVGEDEYVVDARRLIFEVNEICKEIIGVPTTAELLEKGKQKCEVKLAKDIVNSTSKYVECHNCKYQYDCERTYLGGCTDGKEWEEDEGEMLGESKND